MAQDLFDLMFADMDRSLREMGVGDYSISRRVKQMISAFYGRARAYEEAIADPDGDLEGALARNIHRGIEIGGDRIAALAEHVRETGRILDDQPIDSLIRGEVRFEPGGKSPPEDR